ncbi:MAG: hypothetical protein NTX81_11160 [Candidatus Bathyarchaeota archaeon]|nr:hypothetical protein [Candidatus Bathyarchaeota archaeon]
MSDKTGSEDLAETEDVQITSEIKRLAVEELNRDPLKIFLWVYNEIGFIPYGWSFQGSSMTLSTHHGNDYDTSSLLIAMYRAAGIPAKYVQGFVRINPKRLGNWVGADDDMMPFWICMQGNMIVVPNYTEGGSLVDYSLVHCWVKAYISGKWVDLDPSFKEYKYYKKMNFTDVIKPLLPEPSGEIKSETLLRISRQIGNAISSKIDSLPDDTKLKSVTGGQVVIRTDGYVFPPVMVNPKARIESASLTVNDRYMIAFMFPVSDRGSPTGFSQETYYAYNASTAMISDKRITLSFTPSSKSDCDKINSYGGLLFTPCEMFSLKPVLMVDGQPVLVGDSIEPGKSMPYKIITYYPSWVAGSGTKKRWEEILEKNTVAGSYLAISLYLAKIPLDYGKRIQSLQDKLKQKKIPLDDLTGELLNERAMVFWDELEKYETSIAHEYDVVDMFEHASITFSGYEMQRRSVKNKDYLRFARSQMDIHVGHYFLPRTADHPRKVTGKTNSSYVLHHPDAVSANFLHGYFAGMLESYVFYLLYNSPPTSAMHAISMANRLGVPVHLINRENFDKETGLLEYDKNTLEDLKRSLRETVDEGRTAIIPERSIKNEVLTITISTQDFQYIPRKYRTFDVAGYFAVDDEGIISSISVVEYVYAGGFSGVGEENDILDQLLDNPEMISDLYDSTEIINIFPPDVIVDIPPPPVQPPDRLNGEKNVITEINAPGNKLVPDERQVDQATVDMPANAKDIVEVAGRTWKTGDTILTDVELGAKIAGASEDTLEGFGKVTEVTGTISQVIDSGTEYGLYLQNSKDPLILKGIKGYGVWAAEKAVKGVGGVGLGLAAGGLGGIYGLVRGLSGAEGSKMPANEAWDKAKEAYNAVGDFVDGVANDARRTVLDLDPKTGKPMDWERERLAEEHGGKPDDYLPNPIGTYPRTYTPRRPQHLGTALSIIGAFSTQGTQKSELGGSYAWLISDSGLTVGSYLNGVNETLTDMPYIYFDQFKGTMNFYLWNPPPNSAGESYKLIVSNHEESVRDYYIYVELSGGGEQKFLKKIELPLSKGEEALIPLTIIPKPQNGDIELKVDAPKAAYTVTFKVYSPTTSTKPEVFLDDQYLTQIQTGAYKVLGFEKGTKHTIRLGPTSIAFNGTQLPMQDSSWEFSQSDLKIFQYGSGKGTPTPLYYVQSQVDQYTPYIAAVAAVLVAVTVFMLYKRRPPREAVTTAPEKKEKKYCISCGTQINLGAKYCGKCGQLQE